MKSLNQFFLAIALVAFATSFSFAQPPGGPGGQRQGGPPGGPGQGGGPGQAVLEALDANGDHEISAEEIANAAVALKKLDVNGDGKLSDADTNNQGRDQQGEARGNRGGQQNPPRDRNNRGQQGEQGGPGGPPPQHPEGGPGGPPSPEQLVEHAMTFDADNDGKLSREELLKFAESVPPPPQHENGGPESNRPSNGQANPKRPK